MNRKMHVAGNFNCFIDSEGRLKVTDSDIHRRSGNILEMVQDIDVVTTEHL